MNKFKMSIVKTLKDIVNNPPVYANISYLSPNEILAGKHIIITGGTGGIGQAMAKRFINDGASVLITGRNEDALKRISDELGCKSLRLDVTEVESFNAFFIKAIETLDGFDCLVNNAGISLHETFLSVTPDGFDQQVMTNLRGPFFMSQWALSHFEKLRIKGNVLFISSESGETADIRPYGLTKAAINSLVQGLAYLYADKGIRVNAVAPGVTATAMTGLSAENNLASHTSPVGRVYLPDEVAEVAAFLLSDLSGNISGQIITCNNARTVNARWKQ